LKKKKSLSENQRKKKSIEESQKVEKATSKNVFIVHGRDHKSMKELKTMLYEFGLNPIVLHEQPSGSKTVVEKLEMYSDVGYAFVILTPDDIGTLASGVASQCQDIFEFLGEMENAELKINQIKPNPADIIERFIERFKYRSRQNVVLEFGYFIGLLGRDRVCCLHRGDVELPSDMNGIVYITFESSVEKIRLKIMKELNKAGYNIKP
jgi:predicted nucleotide-binding protein